MIELITDANGELKAVCEFYVVDQQGLLNDNGRLVWIQDVYISPSVRGNGILKTFTKNIIKKVPQAEAAYFIRGQKYPDRKPKLYHKRQWLKLLGGEL